MGQSLIIGPIGELHLPRGPARGPAMRDTHRMENAALAIVDGRVAQAGNFNDVVKGFPDATLFDAKRRLVTPGLVDCHTHLVYGGSREGEFIRRSGGNDYEEIAHAGGGILSTMRATREADLAVLEDGIVARAAVLQSNGTTMLEIKASYGMAQSACEKELDAVRASKERIRQTVAVTFMGAHALPPEVSRAEYLELLEHELIPKAASHPARPKFNDVFCERGYFSVEESERVLRAGKRVNLIPKIHSDEFEAIGGTEMACALGAASCDHLLASGAPQIAALAASDTIAVLLPGTAYYLDKPFANARKMIDAGCAVGLGTDLNPGSSRVASMPFVMGLAVSRMGMSPEEALTAATANSAAAIGETIEERADFCVWPCATLAELIYEHTFIRPDAVFIGGEQVA